MTNIVDFEEFADRKQEQIDLRAERDALLNFIQRSDTHVYFMKFALANYSQHVTSTSKQYSAHWLDLAQEFWD